MALYKLYLVWYGILHKTNEYVAYGASQYPRRHQRLLSTLAGDQGSANDVAVEDHVNRGRIGRNQGIDRPVNVVIAAHRV